jgi:hypothetical protein
VHTKLLVDSIMRQTIVLIAQLSTSGGIRAPLSHLADEVFLSLSQELEEQGLSRKVVADMFGMALRGYQRRVQRLRESVTEGGKTLGQAVMEYLQQQGPVTRLSLLGRFRHDDPEAVASILTDLVRTGLLSRTGTGSTAVFAPTPEESRRLLAGQGKEETAVALVWLDVCRHPGSLAKEVAARTGLDEQLLQRALESLISDGRVTGDQQGPLTAESCVIPVGAEVGWEAAVFDHFQAVAAALTAKLRQGTARSAAQDTTGGATLTFEVHAAHPFQAQVLGLLNELRERTNLLWDEVEAENARRPISEEQVQRVIFYFGQYVTSEVDS